MSTSGLSPDTTDLHRRLKPYMTDDSLTPAPPSPEEMRELAQFHPSRASLLHGLLVGTWQRHDAASSSTGPPQPSVAAGQAGRMAAINVVRLRPLPSARAATWARAGRSVTRAMSAAEDFLQCLVIAAPYAQRHWLRAGGVCVDFGSEHRQQCISKKKSDTGTLHIDIRKSNMIPEECHAAE